MRQDRRLEDVEWLDGRYEPVNRLRRMRGDLGGGGLKCLPSAVERFDRRTDTMRADERDNNKEGEENVRRGRAEIYVMDRQL